MIKNSFKQKRVTVTVSRARASLLPVSSCLWAQQWEALGVVCLWQHWSLNTVWLMVQAAVSPSGLISSDSPVKMLFYYHCLLCRSHMVRVKVRLTTAAPRRSTLCGCCYSRGEKHTLTWSRGSFPDQEKSGFSEKDVFPSAASIISATCTLFLLSSALSFAPLCFCVVFTCCMQVTVTHNGDSVASEKQPGSTTVSSNQFVEEAGSKMSHFFFFFFRLWLPTVQWVITASFSHKLKKVRFLIFCNLTSFFMSIKRI